MEIALCTCGAREANRQLRAKDAEIERLKRGLFKCPINHEGCTRNCGSYGCGN